MVSIYETNLSMTMRGIAAKPSAGGGGGGWAFPDGVPTPAVWYSPDNVVIDEITSRVTRVPNLGTGGATLDLVPVSANQMRITAEPTWGGKNVFDTTEFTTGGYATDTATLADARTFMAMTTYKAGAVSFDNYDAIVSGGSFNEFEIVGQSGTDHLFGKITGAAYKDGVALPTITSTLLPLVKNTLAGTHASAGFDMGAMWFDNFGAVRYWEGLTGEAFVWDVQLTPAQIADLHTALAAYYA